MNNTIEAKDNSASMNHRKKHKQETVQMNLHTAAPKADDSVFLFFPFTNFLNAILASSKNVAFDYSRFLKPSLWQDKRVIYFSPTQRIFL